jgi:DNA-binding GntR family transcriptional regulator
MAPAGNGTKPGRRTASEPRTAFNVAYERIKSEILAFRLKPLAPLSEVALAQRLGVSRTPIREAIRRLEREGYVWVAPHKGAFVTPVSLDDIVEIYLIRELLEGAAAAMAAQRITPAILERLRSHLAAVDVGGRVHVERMAAVDAEIHASILRAAGRPKLSALVAGMNEQAQRMRYAGIEVRPRGNRDELLAILDALARRDAPAAEAAMRAHIRLSRESLATIT